MNGKGLIAIAVGIFFVGLGVGYGIFSAAVQQQLEDQQKQITSLQNQIASLRNTTGTQDLASVLDLTSSSASFMQGAGMMQLGANMMLQSQDLMMENRTKAEVMMNQGSTIMEQGFNMMQQASEQMKQMQMPSSSSMMQGFNNMMQNRQNMLDAANQMMQARQMMLGMQRQGMMDQQNMMQVMSSMSQGMVLMQTHMSDMQQSQTMMGMIPMMGVYGFGYMGPMMMIQTSFMGMMNVQTVQPLTIENVKKAAEDFINSLNNPNLAIKDIMEFENNFYFIVYEKNTDIGAFEMLVWKDDGMMGSGIIHPEPGPNMMWNTKYSMVPFAQTTEMRITKDEAKSLAQRYLDKNFPESIAEDTDQFYGYYTIHIEKDGGITGMLSVNGITGDTWYHWWHGQFIQKLD